MSIDQSPPAQPPSVGWWPRELVYSYISVGINQRSWHCGVIEFRVHSKNLQSTTNDQVEISLSNTTYFNSTSSGV